MWYSCQFKSQHFKYICTLADLSSQRIYPLPAGKSTSIGHLPSPLKLNVLCSNNLDSAAHGNIDLPTHVNVDSLSAKFNSLQNVVSLN